MKKRALQRAFTMIEVMIVVTIFGVLINVAAPSIIRARERARARACTKNLKTIDGAKEQWAIDTRAPAGATVTGGMTTLTPTYIKTAPVCPSGGTYTPGVVGAVPACNATGGPFAHVMP